MAPAVVEHPGARPIRSWLMDTTSLAYVLCRIEDDSSLTLVSEHEELSAGIKAGRHMVEVEDHDFSYGLYTSDMAARVAGRAHPAEKSDANFMNTSIHRLSYSQVNIRKVGASSLKERSS
jgi:hypothetical protein